MNEQEAVELYRKYRPQKIGEVVGQKEAIASLGAMFKANKVPHVMLFTGPSGTGKTTLARILVNKLECSEIDFMEINAAMSRGIDTIRDIVPTIRMSPRGKCRIWLWDECSELTPQSQNSLLKILEDVPRTAYFFLCTTDKQKMKPAIITRCTEIKCTAVSEDDLIALITRIVVAEKGEDSGFSEETIKKIAEVADGSPRKALVLLHQVIGINDEEKQIAIVEGCDTSKNSEFIGKMLLNSKTKWPEIAKALKEITDDSVESLRWGILNYAKAVLLNSGNARAALIMNNFRDNFYDSKHAGLAISCWNVLNG